MAEDLMTSDQVHLERRAAQRFEVHTPVSLRLAGSEREACGFAQDLSGRGLLLYTDMTLSQGDALQLTFVMPSEITLGENMRVRCNGRVVRVCGVGTKGGIAVQIEGAYEFLPDEMKHFTATHASIPSENPGEAGMSANVFHPRGATPYWD
jgi:hypothetical protein